MTVTQRNTGRNSGTRKRTAGSAGGTAGATAEPARPADRPAGWTRSRGREPGKYQRVADALREQISSGDLPPNSPLPSHAEMEQRYGVSRTTARAAVEVLRGEGLVVVYNGRGAFVRAERPVRTLTRAITRTGKGGYVDATETDQWRELAPGSETVPEGVGGTFRTDATPELAAALGVPETTPVFVYERLLVGPGGQRMLHRLFLPITVVADSPALTRDPFRAPTDLYRVLERAGYTLGWTETVRARLLSAIDAAALRVPDATPVLLARRTTTDTTTGRVLALEETHLSAEDTQLSYALTTP